MAPTLGVTERPLGPARWGWVGTPDLYRAILEGTPYPVREQRGRRTVRGWRVPVRRHLDGHHSV
jgi:hypothetical protein